MGGGRTQKQQAARLARQQQEARRRYRNIGIALVAVAVVVGTVLVSRSSDKQEEDKLEGAVTAGGCTLDEKTDKGSEHVTSPTFKVDPPAGGDHLAQAAPAGVYQAGQAADGTLVHAMEHGYVILWYQPSLAGADLEALRAVHDEHSDSTLLVERSSIDVPIAVTAWHKRLLCPSFEQAGIVAFVEGYRDKGPESGFL